MSLDGYTGEGTDEVPPLPASDPSMFLRERASFRTQVGSTLFVQFVRLGFAVVQGAIIARWLGPSGKGVLAVALLVPAMLQLLLGLGLGPSLTYHAAASRFPLRTLTRHASAFALIGGAASIALTMIAWATGILDALFPGIPAGIIILGVSGMAIAMLSSFLSSLLQGLQRIFSVNALTLLSGGTMLVLTAVVLLALDRGPVGVVVASLIAGSVGLVAARTAFRGLDVSLRPSLESATVRPLLSYGVRAHAGNVLQFFNYRLDVFVLNFIAGPAAVGVYTVSVRLAELAWQMPNAASFVIFPRAAARSSQEMNRFTPRVFRWTLVLTVGAALGLAVIARPAIRLIYGSAFDGAFLPMLLLLPGVVLLGGGKVLANDVAGRGFPHYNAIVSGTCLILTVLLDLLLIPDHGAAGAAVASTVAYVAVFGLAAAFWVKVRRSSTPPRTDASDAGD
jgi:stage V sporulation protein B